MTKIIQKENERTPKVQARLQTMQEVASDEVERYDWQGLIDVLSALDGETIERDTTGHERDPFEGLDLAGAKNSRS